MRFWHLSPLNLLCSKMASSINRYSHDGHTSPLLGGLGGSNELGITSPEKVLNEPENSCEVLAQFQILSH